MFFWVTCSFCIFLNVRLLFVTTNFLSNILFLYFLPMHFCFHLVFGILLFFYSSFVSIPDQPSLSCTLLLFSCTSSQMFPSDFLFFSPRFFLFFFSCFFFPVCLFYFELHVTLSLELSSFVYFSSKFFSLLQTPILHLFCISLILSEQLFLELFLCFFNQLYF